jgi:hypothetical protein
MARSWIAAQRAGEIFDFGFLILDWAAGWRRAECELRDGSFFLDFEVTANGQVVETASQKQ